MSMKLSVKLLIVCLLVVAVACSSMLKVYAQDDTLTDEQIGSIRNNCVSIKNTLNQLHASDALLRVNRGQLYESISTKLMDQFNSRLANNNFDSSNFVSTSVGYESMLNTFRSDYKSYESKLSAAMDIDCSKQPVAFYDAVSSARVKRKQVHDDVVSLNQYLDQYETLISQFEKDFITTADRLKK
jgi:hypothetical protein